MPGGTLQHFQVNMLVSPNKLIPLSGPTEICIQLDRASPIRKLKPTDCLYYHHTDFGEKDKIRARSHDHKHQEPKIKRPKQKSISILSSVSNKRFNREMKRKAYVEAYGIHFNKVNPDHDPNLTLILMLTKDIRDCLHDVLKAFKDTLFAEPTNLPPERGEDNFKIDLIPEAQPVLQSLRPTLQEQLAELKQQFDALLKKG